MASTVVYRFRLSKEGLKIVNEARKNINRETILIEASKVLDPNGVFPNEGLHNSLYADGINKASWQRFLKGERKIPLEIIAAYCSVLNIAWENVVDWSESNIKIPINTLPRNPLSTDELNSTAKDASKFIRDVTIPDGKIMEPGEKFTKTWEILNAGNMVWKNRYLMRLGKFRDPILISSPRRVKIPYTNPGQIVQISVKLKAPEVATTTEAVWKMTFEDGKLCFPDRYKYGLFVKIQVLQ